MSTTNDDKKPSKSIEKEKTLGIVGALSILVGCIIGSGIFMNVSETLEPSPPSLGLVIIYWTCGGLVAIIGGLCYAELGCTLPESGGERTYFARTFGSSLAVTFTYIYTYLIKGTSIAGISLTVGIYLVEMFLPGCRDADAVRKLVSATAILIAFILNCTSKKAAANIQIIFTVLKLLALFSIIAGGIYTVIKGRAREIKNPFRYNEFHLNRLGNAFINIFWSADGWNILGSVVGEIKNPKRNLPIIMILGVVTVIILYSLTITSYIVVLGYDTVMNSRAVAVVFSDKIFSSFSFAIPILIVCSAFGALNGNLFAIPKFCMVSGYANEIPTVFGLVRREERTPVVSISSLTIASLLFLFFDFDVLVKYCGFLTWAFYFLVMSVIYYIRYKKMGSPNQFRVFIVMPAIIQIVSLYVIYSITVVEGLYVGCIMMTLVTTLIFLFHYFKGQRIVPQFIINAHDWLERFLMRNYNLVRCDAQDL